MISKRHKRGNASKIYLMLTGMIISFSVMAQPKTENLIIITLDGMRWQEIFEGVDSLLMVNKSYTRDSQSVAHSYWDHDYTLRRERLMPFLWSDFFTKGQLFGNRHVGSFVNVTNPYKFSYPGYNEIFTGFPDVKVNSNDKVLNQNENVLEYINAQRGFEGKVVAFTTWDVFPYILNKWRGGMYINSDDTLTLDNPQLKVLNDMQFLTARPLDVRPDIITYMAAREYLKAYKPRVLYIAFDETDDYAHAGMYDQYLKSAHAEDAMIQDLWKLVQSLPEYANKTTFMVTCDHGRGDKVKEQWTSHGEEVDDSGQIWIAAMGPDTSPLGEVKKSESIDQSQLAATFASLLGFDFHPAHPITPAIKAIVGHN